MPLRSHDEPHLKPLACGWTRQELNQFVFRALREAGDAGMTAAEIADWVNARRGERPEVTGMILGGRLRNLKSQGLVRKRSFMNANFSTWSAVPTASK